MKTTIAQGEPDPTFTCPICRKPVVNYLQDAYNHVIFNHMDRVREIFSPEEVNTFIQGLQWEQSTNNRPHSKE